MRFAIVGDVSGKSGCDICLKNLPSLRTKYKVDLIVVNVDNAVHGWGINPEYAKGFYNAGADVLTGGNHIWDQKIIFSYIESDKNLLRPGNYPRCLPGEGVSLLRRNGNDILIIHAMGQIMMGSMVCDDPFVYFDEVLKKYSFVKNIFVDFHAEATSEKMAVSHYLDGRVTAVFGTHTHIPTSDATILKGGTAYQTDVGMTGDYDSVIGMRKDLAISRMVNKCNIVRLEAASGVPTMCLTIVDFDCNTGKALSINPVLLGKKFNTGVSTENVL